MRISTKQLLSALSKSFLLGSTWLVVTFVNFSANAGELAGFVAVERRQFFHHEIYDGQKQGSSTSLILEPEYYHVSDDEKDTYTGRVFLRLGDSDDERNHFDVRQLDWLHAGSDWELGMGISKVYWGVTESSHLVDIINQVDRVEDVDGEDKLGQPMVQVATFKDWGTLRLFYLPYFRKMNFPGEDGRLRSSLVVDKDASYANDAEEFHPDVAVRYENSVDAWDVGLAHFYGTSREPTLRAEQGGKLLAFYEIINQTSLDLQYTQGSWLWKLESIAREGQGDYFGAATGGFEYTFYGVKDTSHDVGILMEFSRDGRDFNAPVTGLDNDIFTGIRYSLNDVGDTQFLGGVTTDVSDGSQLAVFEASHRINTHWKVEFDTRFFINQDADSPLKPVQQDDFAQVRLSYFF